MKSARTMTGREGFSLLEIMVVIVIIGILATYVAINVGTMPEGARQDQAKMQMETFATALKIYKLDNGKYPTTDQGLGALVEVPSTGTLAKRWRPGGYLDSSKVPLDPWDNEYGYISPGEHGDFDIICFGADGEAGGEEYDADINSWELD